MNISAFFLESRQKSISSWVVALWMLILILFFSGFCLTVMGGSVKGWQAVWNYREVFWKGWWLTVLISSLALLLSLIIGLGTALARRSGVLPLRALAILYIEAVRGTPFLVQILLLYYVVANAIGLENRMVAGVVILSLFSGAYLAEIIRSGIESIPSSQWESARAIGLSNLQIYRFVIAPQALRQILPPLAGQFASLIKDSSLLSIIGISEFTLAAQQVNSSTYRTLESYFPLALGYLALTLPISLLAKWLEQKLHYET